MSGTSRTGTGARPSSCPTRPISTSVNAAQVALIRLVAQGRIGAREALDISRMLEHRRRAIASATLWQKMQELEAQGRQIEGRGAMTSRRADHPGAPRARARPARGGSRAEPDDAATPQQKLVRAAETGRFEAIVAAAQPAEPPKMVTPEEREAELRAHRQVARARNQPPPPPSTGRPGGESHRPS